MAADDPLLDVQHPAPAGAGRKQATIDSAFSSANMRRAWKVTVRNGMRAQNIEDLHDYLDVHRNIQPICDRVATDVIRGVYRPQEPEVISSEKRMGVVRRLPAAVDAIVLQTIVDANLARFIQQSAPRWRLSAWAARQVAACQGMLAISARKFVKETVVAGGLLDALQVLSHIEALEKQSSLDKQLTSYLGHMPAAGYPYPLSKFVLAFTLGRARKPDKALVLGILPGHLTDPTYRGRLESLARAGARTLSKS